MLESEARWLGRRNEAIRATADSGKHCAGHPSRLASVVVDRAELAQSIVRAAHITGTFRLRSGQTSTEYFDKYRFESDPVLLRAIAAQLAPLVPAGTDILAGLEMGGIPIVAALSLLTGLPAAFVRKEAKSYGTCRFCEGADVAGRRTLLVEDVVTSGGQLLKSAEQLRAIGAEITTALCVIDREGGGRNALRQIDITLSSLFTKTQLDVVA